MNPEKHVGLVYLVVNKMIKKNPHLGYIREDLIGEGMVHLVSACKDYDSSRSLKASTYIVNMIINGITNYLIRYEYKHRNHEVVFLDDLIVDDEEIMEWQDVIPGTIMLSPWHLPKELREFVEAVVSTETLNEARVKLNISWEAFYDLKNQLKSFKI